MKLLVFEIDFFLTCAYGGCGWHDVLFLMFNCFDVLISLFHFFCCELLCCLFDFHNIALAGELGFEMILRHINLALTSLEVTVEPFGVISNENEPPANRIIYVFF